MKKIFHFLNSGDYSGAENMVLTISDLLNNYSHFYVSPSGKINEVMNNYNINKIDIKSLNLHNMKNIIEIYKPDIVHCHDVTASVYGAMLKKLISSYGGKLISHIHNNDPRMRKIGLRSLIYNFTIKNYDQILVVSKAVLSEYIFRKNMQEKSIVIENVINETRVKEKSKEYTTKKYNFCFIGRLENQKNPEEFVNIIKEISNDYNVNAVMVGGGSLRDEVREIIESNNLENVIELTGFLNNPYPYIKNSDAIVIPSRYEGFGLVALEAMILKTPVVASRVGGLSYIVGETGTAGFLCKSRSEFIKSCTNIISEEKKTNPYKRAKKINNISMFIEKLEQVYQ